jgi:TonB family protein
MPVPLPERSARTRGIKTMPILTGDIVRAAWSYWTFRSSALLFGAVKRNLPHIVRNAVVPPVILILALFLIPTSVAQEQPASEQTLAALAHALATKLTAAGVNRIVILDFEDANRHVTVFGGWLADQLASSPGNPWGSIEVIGRDKLAKKLKLKGNPEAIQMDSEQAIKVARSFKATAIQSSYSAAENGIGVTLTQITTHITSSREMPLESSAKIMLTEEMKSHLPGTLELLLPADGVFIAGRGGVGLPVCIHCPNPNYTSEVARRGIQGIVLMSAVITDQGLVANLSIEKKLDYELDQVAVATVKNWRFNPAMNVDGKAVPVHVPIEVRFRLYD